MPPVHIEIALGAIGGIGSANIVHAGIGCGKFPVFSAKIKIVCAAEIVFRSSAANGGKRLVAVYVEFNFALAPPAVGLCAPMHISTDIMPVALDIIQNYIVFHIGQGINPTELSMKVQSVLGKRLFFAIDLIIYKAGIHTPVFQCDTEGFEKSISK